MKAGYVFILKEKLLRKSRRLKNYVAKRTETILNLEVRDARKTQEKIMIVFTVFGFCAVYFFYLKKWAESFLLREYHFSSPSPPQPLPHSPEVSIIVASLWGIFLLFGVFWGFTYIRYPDHLTIRDSDAEIGLFILLSITVWLSYFVVYRLGEIRGVAQMKNTVLFMNGIRKSDDA
jgi:hypothetical protein